VRLDAKVFSGLAIRPESTDQYRNAAAPYARAKNNEGTKS
jgi:hypothetical protein